MSQQLTEIPHLLLEELNDREQLLWQLLQEREELIKELKDEIARLKGEKGRPKIKQASFRTIKKLVTGRRRE